MKHSKIFLSFLILGLAIILLPAAAKASITNGTIDSTNKYAWGENIGWINFGTANGSVAITDTAVTGYAWSPNYGWINLAPSTSGVKNDGEGNLSGSAWGENIGWMDFSGVKILANGEFSGYATTTNFGAINLNCKQDGTVNSCDNSNFKVQTDWRPISSRVSPLPAGALNPPGSSGGGSTANATTTNQSDNFAISINSGATQTANPIVTITFKDGNVSNMAISNSAAFTNANQQAYASPVQWNICSQSGSINDLTNCSGGTYTVFAKFYSKYGVPSRTLSASIIFFPATSTGAIFYQPFSTSSSSLIGASSSVVNQITAGEAENIFASPSLSALTVGENINFLKIIDSADITQNEKFAIADFIHFGTPTTLKMGSGERAGSIDSFQGAFNRLPTSLLDWQDVIKIANGRWPSQRSAIAEARAKINFKLVYSRAADMLNIYDNAAVTVMAYGLRPAARNLNSEKAAIKSFRFIFQRTPITAREWDVVRAIAYSGAKK